MRDKSKKDSRMFVIIALAALVLGVGMLAWGQYNSAEQVFEIAFQHYKVGDQLSADSDYVFSDEDAAMYDKMLDSAKGWESSVTCNTGSCTTSTVARLFGNFASYDMPYSFYNNNSDTTVILLSGYNETDSDSAVYAPYWWEKGFNVLIPQLRGVTDELKLTAFGYYEQYDIYDLIKYLKLDNEKIILHGRGSGAAAAILLSANKEYPCGVDLVVSDSVYSSMKELEMAQLKAQFGLGEYFTGFFMDRIIKSELRFNVTDVDIADAAGKSSAPIFFACGANDTFVGKDNTYAVYSAAKGQKEVVTIENAANRMAYTESFFTGGEYCSKLDEFITEIDTL